MFHKLVTVVSLLATAVVAPLGAQDAPKLNFNIGGGISTPLNPTARYVGLSGNFVTGAGYNIDKHHSIIGQFMWSGLPPNIDVLHFPNAPFGSVNLYTLTANYRYKLDRLGGSPFGAYLIAGGGWYYRFASIDKNYVVPPDTVCQPVFTWWGYACLPSGFVYTATIASKGVSAGGLNGGVGFTVRLGDKGWKFYMESRYHYAFHPRIPTTLIPVTFGIGYN
jgi:hypothetical protein